MKGESHSSKFARVIINEARVFSNCLFIVFRFLYIHILNYLNAIWEVKAQSLWGRVKIITNE